MQKGIRNGIIMAEDKNLQEKEVNRMATQIAATPVVKGSEAVKIFKEANRKPSKESEKGAKKLADIFEKMMR